jgi:hypothetical protein
MQYYGVTAPSEYATDLVFKSRPHLAELFPRLAAPSPLTFTAQDVMSFLGRKSHGKFEGEVGTDQAGPLPGRIPGRRVKEPGTDARRGGVAPAPVRRIPAAER